MFDECLGCQIRKAKMAEGEFQAAKRTYVRATKKRAGLE